MGFVASVRGPIPATDLPFFSCNAASSCSQRLHVERLMEALGERRARSWDGAEDVGRLARTAQPLQIRPPSIFGDRPHGRGVPIFFAEVRPTSGAAIWFPHLYRARNLVEGTAANPEPVGLPAYGGCGFQRLVPAFDLARGHRMMWSPADMVHVVGIQPFGQVVGDV